MTTTDYIIAGIFGLVVGGIAFGLAIAFLKALSGIDADGIFAASANIDNFIDHQQTAIKVSVARCARVSYLSNDTGKRSTVEEDLKLYDRLLGAQPLHASPAEHQATPDENVGNEVDGDMWAEKGGWGNFVGWRQYRKMLANEACAPLPQEYAPK